MFMKSLFGRHYLFLSQGIKIQTVGSHSYWVMTFKLQYGDDLQKLKYARNSNDLEVHIIDN